MSKVVCPWWLGHILACPLRRIIHDPYEILSPYVHEGMHVLDVGCGMGFFSLPLARLVGEKGKVVCLDLQQKMIDGLVKKAKKAGLMERIDPRVCAQTSLGLTDLAGEIDFAIAFAMVHEVPDQERLFSELSAVMKQGGSLLIAEPKGHVTKPDFERAVSIAKDSGFEVISELKIRKSHAVLMQLHHNR